MTYLALDIGGANLKSADGQGYAHATRFALWRNPQGLSQALRTHIAEAPPSDHLLATMTGELADCFADKAEGVTSILAALEEAAGGRHTRVYLVDGRLVSPQVALRHPQLVAAANWHALARFAGRFAPQGASLLIDLGSTTCDVIPLIDGQPAAVGATDTDRLLAGELIYTGIERSPLCAVSHVVPYRDGKCPPAQELFATMRDVYLILGDVAEDPTCNETADGRVATKAAARARLARVVCADAEQFHHRDAVVLARAVAADQLQLIAGCVERVLNRLPAPPAKVVLAGQGELMARRVLQSLSIDAEIVSLARELGSVVSRCAAAHALASLAQEPLP